MLTREQCTTGTRVDILERIYWWAVNSSPDSPSVFWLAGQAGSGKSTIACTVADHFDKGTNPDPQTVLGANFFCSRQFEDTRRRKYIIPTIAYQLAHQFSSYASALSRTYKFDSADVLSKQLKDLLIDPWRLSANESSLSGLPQCLVIVDALDEIEDRGGSKFLQDLLETMREGHLGGLKFLITSRPDPELAKLCSSFESHAICRLYEVPTADVEADIDTYLKAKLPELRDEPQLATLVQKADGLFIYAATIVRYIKPPCRRVAKLEQLRLMDKMLGDCPPLRTSQKAVIPSLIDALYQQILRAAFCELDETMSDHRLKILHTLLCTEERISTSVAGRPASDLACTEELAEVAKVVVDDLHAVLYFKGDRVFWYHASFPDFMFDKERSKFKISDTSGTGSQEVDMSCNTAAHHAFLTHSCFRIMNADLRFNICNLPSSFLLDDEVPDLSCRVQENIGSAVEYSSRFWAQHLYRVDCSDQEAQRSQLCDFLRVRVLFWIESMNLLGSKAQCTPMLQRAREWVVKVGNSCHLINPN